MLFSRALAQEARIIATAILLAAPGICPAQTASSDTKAETPKKWYDTIKLSGYAQLDSTFGGNNSQFGQYSNFRIRRARPTLTADIDPLTTLKIQFDAGTGKANSGQSNNTVTDTWAQRLIPGFGYVRMGHMLIPFGYEVDLDTGAARTALEESFAAAALSLSDYDVGITVGSHPTDDQPAQWQLGFYNGQGIRSADANANKTFVARLAASPACCKFVRVGVSTIQGQWRDTRAGHGTDYNREAYGAELHITPSKALELHGELYNAHFVDSMSAPTGATTFTGGYLMLKSWIGSLKSVPFLRYQRTYGGLEYRSFDLGWRYDFARNQRLTLEYDIVRAASSDQFGARWQIMF